MTPRAALGLLVEGLSTNLWGLGCPFYCASPSVGLLAFLFLAGWILGIISTLAVLWWISGCGLPTASSSSVPVPRATASVKSRVLAGYLHEQGSFGRERIH